MTYWVVVCRQMLQTTSLSHFFFFLSIVNTNYFNRWKLNISICLITARFEIVPKVMVVNRYHSPFKRGTKRSVTHLTILSLFFKNYQANSLLYILPHVLLLKGNKMLVWSCEIFLWNIERLYLYLLFTFILLPTKS